MKTYDFKFYKLRDKEPEEGAEIIYIETSRFYGGYEFRFGRADYQYEEIDEEDDVPTGVFFCEVDDPEDPSIKVRKFLVVNGEEVDSSLLWAPAEDADKVLDLAEEDEKALDSRHKDE
jgi:hypothetical protein